MSGKRTVANVAPGYSDLLAAIVSLLEEGRRAAPRSVNAVLITTYWLVGRRLIEHEQAGKSRAVYGSELLKRLSRDLQSRLGPRFSERNLEQMRAILFAVADSADADCKKRSGECIRDFADAVCEIPLYRRGCRRNSADSVW